MHSGFYALRSSLPMNLRARRPGFPIWSGPKADVERIVAIWRDCFAGWGGPFLFGDRLTVADAMYAPVVTRFLTYDVALDRDCAAYGERIMALASDGRMGRCREAGAGRADPRVGGRGGVLTLPATRGLASRRRFGSPGRT